MENTINWREYRLKNLRVSIMLVERRLGGRDTFYILEEFKGGKGRNKLLRGVYDNKDVAQVEYNNIVHKIENTLPASSLIHA